MKISALILSVCGFCIFYICNADWIDELIEDYLGSDYEEVAPFISSVTAGAEEFDQLVEELSQSRRWWRVRSWLAVVGASAAAAVGVACLRKYLWLKDRGVLSTGLQLLTRIRKSGSEKEVFQTVVAEFLERKLKNLFGEVEGDDIPVKLLWKGGNLVESSIHCSVRNESKLQHIQRHLLQSQLLYKSPDGGGDETLTLVPSTSDSSTAQKMVEIRKLLESEQELGRFVEKGARADDRTEKGLRESGLSYLNARGKASLRSEGEFPGEAQTVRERVRKFEGTTDHGRKEEPEGTQDSDWNGFPDPKLMNRIRLLESRLRLEELKNKNWISRMSRAEGILQQLNKQVERIEETRPVGTLTETLKITSTVTNWAPPPPQPRRNMHFTMVSQYPPFSTQPPYTSLSELIKREVGLPSTSECGSNLLQLPPAPVVPALASPTNVPPSSFLSKFLCR